jgi:hypothetical protein
MVDLKSVLSQMPILCVNHIQVAHGILICCMLVVCTIARALEIGFTRFSLSIFWLQPKASHPLGKHAHNTAMFRSL